MSKTIDQKVEAVMKSVSARQQANGEFECVAPFGGNNNRPRMRGVGSDAEQAKESLRRKLRKMYTYAN